MATEHWFDELHRTLTEEAPRRGLLRSGSALVAGLTLGVASQMGSAKKNKKGKKDKKKGKGNGNDKGKKDEKKVDLWGCEDRFQNLRIKDPNCSGGACKSQWPDDPCEEKYCEFICNQCDEDDPRDFCIARVGRPVATCCREGHTCCGGVCCGGIGNGTRRECCDGKCRSIDVDPNHCGACNHACGENETCEAGFCVTGPGPGCVPALCPNLGEICVNGRCACPEGESVCNGSCGPNPQTCLWDVPDGQVSVCIPADWKCCDGFACPPRHICCPKTQVIRCRTTTCDE